MDFLRWLVTSVVALVGGVLGFEPASLPPVNDVQNTVVIEQQLAPTPSAALTQPTVSPVQPTTASAQPKTSENIPKQNQTVPITNADVVLLKPVADSDAGIGSVQILKVQRGSRVKMSWNVSGVENCSVHVYRDIRYADSYDNWGENILPKDSRQTDPVNHDQKYRLICVSNSNYNLLAATLELKVLPATKAPTCRVTADPMVAEEGQTVTYTIQATDVAKFGFGAFSPEPLDWRTTFPYKLPLKARANATTQTFTVANEVGSAQCSVTITVAGQSNSEGISLVVEKIPSTFVWSEANPNIPLTYTITATSPSAKPSEYSLCASMRDSNNVQVTEEDCSAVDRWGRVEILDDLSLAPDTIRHKDFWDTPGSKKLKVFLRVVKGAYGIDGSNIQSSLAEGDTGYFTLSL